MMSRFVIFGIALTMLAVNCSAAAEDTDNERIAWDISSRYVDNESTDGVGFMHAFGVDYHKVFSVDGRDIGTLTAQLYLTRIDNLKPHPGFFDDSHDWEMVKRIVNFNYTGLGRDLPNIKVGHIELPFGIEYRINTNGTLRQYSHGLNLGPKADWGISVNQQTEKLDYEFSLTTGGGQSLDSNDSDSYVFTGYVGNADHHNLQYGLSVNRSRINQLERQNIAADVAYYYGVWGVLAEILSGEKMQQSYHQVFVEVNKLNLDDTWLNYLQFRQQIQDANTSRRDIILGTELQFNHNLVISGQFTQMLEQDTYQVSGQMRWRF